MTKRRLALALAAVTAFGSCCGGPEPHSDWAGDRSGPPGSGIVVFVHGVLGDGVNTWKRCDCGPGWPEFFRDDPKLRDWDVYVYSYYSKLFCDGPSITDVAKDLNEHLKNLGILAANGPYRKAVFVAHSMGSLVVKTALIDPSWDEHGIRVPLVICLSPPMGGSEYARRVTSISNNPQFAGLCSNGEIVIRIDDEWRRERASKTKVVCACETTEYPGLGEIIVGWRDITAGSTGLEDWCKFHEDHSTIAKPRGLFDPVHLWTRRLILEHAK